MALQFKKGNRNMKFALTSGAIIVGGVFLILKSYPHVKAALFSKGTSTTVSEADDSTPVELNKEDSEDEVVPELILNESLVNIELMSEDELKKWLSEVCIICNCSILFYLTLLTFNPIRKKLILHRMLLILTLFPLLSQFKKLLLNYGIVLRFNITAIAARFLLILKNIIGLL